MGGFYTLLTWISEMLMKPYINSASQSTFIFTHLFLLFAPDIFTDFLSRWIPDEVLLSQRTSWFLFFTALVQKQYNQDWSLKLKNLIFFSRGENVTPEVGMNLHLHKCCQAVVLTSKWPLQRAATYRSTKSPIFGVLKSSAVDKVSNAPLRYMFYLTWTKCALCFKCSGLPMCANHLATNSD